MAWKFQTDIFTDDAPIIRGDEENIHKEKVTKALSCGDCPLNLSCKSPKLSFIGEGAKGVLILGSHPSKDEDMAGELGHGKAYEFLADTLKNDGIDLLKDCYYMTAVSCRTPKEREPTLREVQCCSSRIHSVITKLNPKAIILLGQGAFNSIIYPKLTGRIGGTGWEKFCGDVIPDQEYEKYLIPTWDSRHFLEKKKYDDGSEGKPLFEQDKAWYNLWRKHLLSAFDCGRVVKNNYAHDCFTTTKVEQAIAWILDAMDWKFVSFDYETNSIKGYRQGSKILCASISDGLFAYSFPFFNDEKFRKAWKALMLSDSGKISHNLQFEATWTKCKEGYWPKNWEWDTMLGQHSYHNQKPTGLKYCTYAQIGDIGYDDLIDKYLKADKQEEAVHGTNAFNKMEQAPLEGMLQYNALDSLYAYKLYQMQKASLTEFQIEGVKFLTESAVALAKASHEGFLVDQKAFDKAETDAIIYQARLKEELMALPEIKMWDLPEPLNIDAPAQMAHLFFEVLKYKPTSFTAKGGVPSVDKNFLEKSDTTFTRKLIEYRETVKMIGTYIADYKRENLGGYVHPSFMLNTVDTFRSCVAKGSLVLAPDRFVSNPKGIPIEEIKAGDFVYTYDDDLKLAIKKVIWAGKTGTREVIRVHFGGGRGYSNETYLDVTPEHRIRSIDGTYIQAQDLLDYDSRDKTNPKWKYQPKSRVLSCHRVDDRIFPTNQPESQEHRFVYEFFSGEHLTPDDVIHHKDRNHCNHTFSNLVKLDKAEHALEHYSEFLGTVSFEQRSAYTKLLWKEGKFNPPSGVDAYSYQPVSRTECLRLFVEARGKLRETRRDFTTYLKKCAIVQLDIHALKIRYNSKGEYLSRWKVQKVMSSTDVNGAMKLLGVGYYRLKNLCIHYGMNVSDIFGKSKYAISPWKEPVTINNHIVTKIERLGHVVDVYDLEVEDTHNFICNEVCVHNSSKQPNVQNIPKRNLEVKKLLRSFLIPKPGAKIVEYDYKALEVVINGTHSKDPNMKKYIVDPTTDMHRDSAMDCFILKADEVKKEWRSACKSFFTFSILYGNYYKNMAKNLWEYVNEVGLIKHLNEKGVKSYQQYEDKIKEAERIFWEERFPKHDEWRKQMWKDYQKRGYLDSFTGFRMQAPMKRNNSFNCKVQGDAYHVLQWVMNRVTDMCEKKGLRSRPIGEIHDALVMNVYPEEEAMVDYIVWLYGTVKVREYWTWIDLPLTLEKESSKIDGSWADMEGCGSLQFE